MSGLTIEGMRKAHELLTKQTEMGERVAAQYRAFLRRLSDPSIDALAAADEVGLGEWARAVLGMGPRMEEG